MADKVVKQFGLKRSGTNYTAVMMQRHTNAKILTNGGGWKHGKYRVPSVLGHEVDCIVTTKHPLSWLCSMYRWEKCPKTFSVYLKRLRRELIEVWSLMHENWLSASLHMKKKKMIFVKYEDLIADGPKTTDRIAKELGLTRTKKWEDLPRRLDTIGHQTATPFNRAYYMRKQYMKDYSAWMLDLVYEHLDLDILGKMGYKVERTA